MTPRRVLVLTGGPDYAHDFATSGAALADLVRARGMAAELHTDPDAAAMALAGGGYAALLVNALRWRMLHPRYAQWRDAWAYATPLATRHAIAQFVAQGGGLVGNHTAPICFDDWPEWGEVLGGAWDWERSSHPPLGPVTAHVVQARAHHPVVRGLPAVVHAHDEVYGGLCLQPGVDVLVTARRTPDDDDQPVVWAHRFGQGRVAYVCFGHDAASIAHPHLTAVIGQALEWVVG